MRTLAWDLVQCVTNPETFGTIITAICNQNEPRHGDTEINSIIAVSPSWRIGGNSSDAVEDVLRFWQLFIVLFIFLALSVARSER